MEITLPSGRKIGENHPPFIIAEIGSNWTSFEDCKDAIIKAKACGADAVKFQAFTHESLYGMPDPGGIPGFTMIGVCDGKMFKEVNTSVAPYSLPLEWLPKLKEKADACGIEFMVSAFSPELIDAVDPYVNIHKVASAECTHKRMLERLRDTGKPVILSTGAHGEADIRMALSVLGHNPDVRHVVGRTEYTVHTDVLSPKACPIVLMYCVAAYPARQVDLYQIHTLRAKFDTLAGYSDHTTDVETIPPLASSHGACVIEKHVTFIEADTPDSPHSLTGDEFKRMVVAIMGQKYKAIQTPLDICSPWKSPTPAEKPMILRHNRRLIATKDIKAGEGLSEGHNFGIYRSLKDETHAYSPMMIDEVNGRVAKRDIKAGDGIGPGDV